MQKGIAMRKNLVIAALFGLALAPAGASLSSASPLGLAATAATAPEALITPVEYVPGTVRGGGAVAPRGVAPRPGFVPGRVPGTAGAIPGAGGARVFGPGAGGARVFVPGTVRGGGGPGYVYRGGAWGGGPWVRPRWYRWAPGGAILAGAAIGFIVASNAYSWAGPPPAPGYCWYYTDPSMQDGFWDICP